MSALFHCDLGAVGEEFPHFWEHTVGSGHATLALRADWREHMRRAREELGFRHVRFHGLLSDDMGTLVEVDDKPLYSFFNADSIVDFLLSIGMRPFVELSFMPTMLASGDEVFGRYRANVTPPKYRDRWEELIERLTRHWVERYGRDEVRQWFFEVWNEPNEEGFWSGGQKDYFKLYASTIRAVKAVDPQLKVGGPATSSNAWLTEFLAYCRANSLPVDFVTTHHYPTDAVGSTSDDTETELAKSERSALCKQARMAKEQAGDLPLFYTEWNVSSNPRDPLHDEPFAAAFLVKTVMEARSLVEGYSYWTFSDIFEENYFPSIPFHGGFGLMTIHGIAKPSYRAFELLHGLANEWLDVAGEHPTVDAWATRDRGGATFLLTNFALPRHPVATQTVQLRLTQAPAVRSATIRRIDDAHANARARWQEMGAPDYLDDAAVRELHEASAMPEVRQEFRSEGGIIDLEVALPPQGIAAVRLEFDAHA